VGCFIILDVPSGEIEKDLNYAEEIELAIREWQEKEFNLEGTPLA
jgi:hypothetical protein